MQHPLEVDEAKGTGRLLHLSLTNSTLIAGETLTDAAMKIITNSLRQSVLLYPDPAQLKAIASDASDAPDAADAADAPYCGELVALPDQLRLIVLDATWRKSRKMLHVNPLLQSLPRLALNTPPPSRYAIRKSHHAHQLSTLEATCYALLQLGAPSADLLALLHAFDGFVMQQALQQQSHQQSSRAFPRRSLPLTVQ